MITIPLIVFSSPVLNIALAFLGVVSGVLLVRWVLDILP